MSDNKEKKPDTNAPDSEPNKKDTKELVNKKVAENKSTSKQPSGAGSKPQQNEKVSKPKQADASVAPQKKGGFLSFIALLFAFVAIAFSAYLYQQLQQMKVAEVVEDSGNDGLLNDINSKLQQNESRFTDISQALDDLVSKQGALENMMPEPVNQTVDVNEEFALAEVEHLLSIANYRLALNHDVETALAAMQSADQRLQGLRIPNVLQAREQIIADMNSLRSLNQADLSGLGLFLSDLINRVDNLPLKQGVIIEKAEFISPNTDNSNDNIALRFISQVWAELKSLVVISRDGEVSKTRMLPDEIYFLYANIKLELANARFAVFNRDTENFRASIEHIRSWLNEYFDLSDAAVSNVFDSLFRMSKIDLAFPAVDISSSVESVRALARRQATMSSEPPLSETEEMVESE